VYLFGQQLKIFINYFGSKMKKRPSAKSLIKKADKLASEYVRRVYANSYGTVQCYTCGTIKPIKEMTNGHFVSRRKYQTRWMLDNMRPQCYQCNICFKGEQFKFGKKLQEEGIDIERIVRYSRITGIPARDPATAAIEFFTEKLKNLS
jgi:hypothetical protein